MTNLPATTPSTLETTDRGLQMFVVAFNFPHLLDPENLSVDEFRRESEILCQMSDGCLEMKSLKITKQCTCVNEFERLYWFGNYKF